MPADKEQKPESLVQDLKKHFSFVAEAYDPAFIQAKAKFKSFCDGVCTMLQDTAASGPDKNKWLTMTQEGTTTLCHCVLEKYTKSLSKACAHTGIEGPAVLVAQQGHIREASAFQDLFGSVTALFQMPNGQQSVGASSPEPKLIGDVIKKLKLFETYFKSDSEVYSLSLCNI